jgi:hypothetical protein
VNDTEENDTFKIEHVRGTETSEQKKRRLSTSKRRRIHLQETTRKEHKRFQNNENADRKRMSISAFKETATGNNDVTDDARKIRAKDLKKTKTAGLF